MGMEKNIVTEVEGWVLRSCKGDWVMAVGWSCAGWAMVWVAATTTDVVRGVAAFGGMPKPLAFIAAPGSGDVFPDLRAAPSYFNMVWEAVKSEGENIYI